MFPYVPQLATTAPAVPNLHVNSLAEAAPSPQHMLDELVHDFWAQAVPTPSDAQT